MTSRVGMAERGALERPSVQIRVIRALAKKERPAAVARQFGVTRQAMQEFRDRHRDRIAEVAANLDDAFAGIEFANKGARVAELSRQVRDIADLLADPETAAKAGVQRAEMERVVQSGLRGIAEELGQLPSRMQVQVGGQLDVAINGVALADLQ